jgi:hypothetical protein
LLQPDAYHADAWELAKPTMTTRANLSVFLYELQDLRRMFQILPKKFFKGGWRDVIKYANDTHLNVNFGWRPFLGELKRFFRGYTSFETRLARFIKNADQSLRRRVRRDPQQIAVDVTTHPFVNQSWGLRVTGSVQVEYVSAFRFLYSIPSYGAEEMKFRAWLDTFGLNLSAADAWAVVPYSFVVDWFANVGDQLDRTKSDWLEPWVDLTSASYSRRLTGTLQVSVITPSVDGSRLLPAANVTMRQYTRNVGFPTTGLTIASSLDADKIRLGGSLILGRLL